MTDDCSLFDALRRRPWNSRRFSIPAWVPKYPTMLTEEEMRMLAWTAQHIEVSGDVLDMGAFLGGSAVSLATGVSAAKSNRTVHSYDKFAMRDSVKEHFLYSRGLPHYAPRNTLPLFRRMTARYRSIIVPHKGDFLQEKRLGPVAVLFNDISKSWALNDHILTEFMVGLQPGAVIVQQDYLTIRVPWLYSTMEKLAHKVDFLTHTTDCSVLFGVREPLTAADIEPCLAANTTSDEVSMAIKANLRHFNDLRQREMVEAALGAFEANPETKEAWAFADVTGLQMQAGRARAGGAPAPAAAE